MRESNGFSFLFVHFDQIHDCMEGQKDLNDVKSESVDLQLVDIPIAHSISCSYIFLQ